MEEKIADLIKEATQRETELNEKLAK